MQPQVIRAYFQSLARGDAEAIWFTIIVASVGLALVGLVLLVVWRAKCEDRRYREELRKRRGY